jgi:hypothetical protein
VLTELELTWGERCGHNKVICDDVARAEVTHGPDHLMPS